MFFYLYGEERDVHVQSVHFVPCDGVLLLRGWTRRPGLGLFLHPLQSAGAALDIVGV